MKGGKTYYKFNELKIRNVWAAESNPIYANIVHQSNNATAMIYADGATSKNELWDCTLYRSQNSKS